MKTVYFTFYSFVHAYIITTHTSSTTHHQSPAIEQSFFVIPLPPQPIKSISATPEPNYARARHDSEDNGTAKSPRRGPGSTAAAGRNES
ncbi:hypothetical protein EVAR_32025_1 [Eumeta japonica]|uniref:Uncharacterized protein n=1 Tax=Eumeta variegata TaxID=151549 RepID=A0A4C1YIF4_EUMVA|nr:hypothetical protein EVAR_32025_1 [Eumeta japonica]